MTSYEKILEDVLAIKIERGELYRVEPKDVVPIEVLEAVILLKAYRGYEGLSTEKKIDEYRDTINYCAFAIERLEEKRARETENAG